MPRWVSAVVFGLTAFGCAAQEPTAPTLKLSGYYKNLFVQSETVFPAGQSYVLDLNRLRLQLAGYMADAIAVDIQYDNEASLGSYVRTTQFQILKERPTGQYWTLRSNYAEGDSYYALHGLYRANMTLSRGEFDLRVGRQRIAWGTGRFWSPTDLLNPFSPVRIERDERAGVDAALAEYKLGALSRASAVYAPSHADGRSSGALRWHDNVAATDYSVMAGRFAGDRVVGGDLAGQVADTGVRAELTHTRSEAGPTFWRALAGIDYAFPNTLSLTAELYYNGAGATSTHDYDFAALFSGKVQSLARPYFGGYAGYDITPLLKSNNYAVANFRDGSWFFSPTLTYSVRTDLDVTLGAQIFRGRSGSEYGAFADVYYLQVQSFF
jgi:hypothetical protein